VISTDVYDLDGLSVPRRFGSPLGRYVALPRVRRSIRPLSGFTLRRSENSCVPHKAAARQTGRSLPGARRQRRVSLRGGFGDVGAAKLKSEKQMAPWIGKQTSVSNRQSKSHKAGVLYMGP